MGQLGMTTSLAIIMVLAFVVPWIALTTISAHYRRICAKLFVTNDRLTDEIVGLKNPWVQSAVADARAQRSQQAARDTAADADDEQSI